MTIKEGTHNNFELLLPFYNKTIFERRITFTKESEYILNDEDQEDINKLFGFTEGFKWGKKENGSYGFVNSCRIGWRYSPRTNKHEILSFVERDGEFITETLGFVNVDEPVIIKMEVSSWFIRFHVNNVHKHSIIRHNPLSKTLGFMLGFYFGGNQKAPKDITVNIEKL